MAFENEDAWERKTRPQFRESDLSRRLLQIARDPNATSPKLDAVADEALAHLNAQWYPANGCVLVIEALAAHPNTPPARFNEFLLRTTVARRAFCRNPVAPFLLLEDPNFINGLHEHSQRELLREADLPPTLAYLLASGHAANRAHDITETARMHIAVAGEAQSQAEWEAEARRFYQKVAREETDGQARDWYAELVEIGFLPEWADGGNPFSEPKLHLYGATSLSLPAQTRERNVEVTLPSTPTHRLVEALKQGNINTRRLARRHPNAPPDASEICRREFAERWHNGIHGYAEEYDKSEATRRQSLVTLASALHGIPERQNISNKAVSQFWTERFEAVWVAFPNDEPLPGGVRSEATGRELLIHLARDANRIVRGAAKTRLSDPDYRFSLWDEKDAEPDKM